MLIEVQLISLGDFFTSDCKIAGESKQLQQQKTHWSEVESNDNSSRIDSDNISCSYGKTAFQCSDCDTKPLLILLIGGECECECEAHFSSLNDFVEKASDRSHRI